MPHDANIQIMMIIYSLSIITSSSILLNDVPIYGLSIIYGPGGEYSENIRSLNYSMIHYKD